MGQTIIELVEKLLDDSGIQKEEVTHIGIGSSEEIVPKELKDIVQNELNILCHIANGK